MGRFDFFRMLLPGAIVAVLVYVATYVVAVTPGVDSSFGALTRQLLADPFTGLAIAFGIGLVLYAIDPAYSSPDFYRNIPSDHLQKRLDALYPQAHVDHLSLYFLVADHLMPEPLRERALLYGALMRVGLQLTIYTIFIAAASPVAIMWIGGPGSQRDISGQVDWSVLAIAALVALVVLGITALKVRVQMRPAGARPIRSLWQVARDEVPTDARVVASGLLASGVLTAMSLHVTAIPAWIVLPTLLLSLLTLVAWMFLRFLGPVGPRLEYLSGERSSKPNSPHRHLAKLVLDGAAVLSGTLVIAAIGPHIRVLQAFIIAMLLIIGVVLSYARKFERQNQGLYRNQNEWIDLHIHEIAEWIRL